MRQFLDWYYDNFEAITWFIMGFLTMGGIVRLEHGQYDEALLEFVLVGINYWMLKRQ